MIKLKNPFVLLTHILICSLTLSFSFPQFGFANEQIRLKNGNYAQIDVYTPTLIRVRISLSEKQEPSLMERYGILKTEGAHVNYEKKINGKHLSIQTAEVILKMELADGSVTLKRKDQNFDLVGAIKPNIKNGDPFMLALGKSLNTYFEKKLPKPKDIIGDSAKKKVEIAAIKVGESSVLSFSLKDQERFYGLGNASRESIQHRGQAIRMWVQYQHSESPIPFIMSNKGWGVFYNTTRLHFFDVGKYSSDKMHIYEPVSKQLDYFLFEGENMQDVLNQYTDLTGKSYVLPRWAYGMAFGSNTMENQFNVLDNAYRFRQERIPCDIYWLEPQWMEKRYDFSTAKNWNNNLFVARLPWTANPNALFIKRLKNMGFKTALWLCVDHDFSIEEEDRISKIQNKPLSGKEHWFTHLNKFIDQGVSGFKLDPSRTLDEHPDLKYFNGRRDDEMHMLNQVLLLKNAQKSFLSHTGKRTFQHYCGGYAGIQHYGASTLGDNGGKAETMTDVFNLGMSGNSNVSCDMLDEVDPLLPGMHMGFFLPWVQLNSWAYTVYPFYFSEKDKAAFRFYGQLRYQLNPYIYSNALVAAETGLPIARPMPLIYPENEKLANVQKQFMFGENFLVAAFTNNVILPSGKWIDFWTNKAYEGDSEVTCQLPANAGGPLFIKAGAIIPFQKPVQFIEVLPPDTLIIKVYPHKKSTYTLLEDDGETHAYENGGIARTKFTCNEHDGRINFSIAATTGNYKGRAEKRVYQLEFHQPSLPRQVSLNGEATKDWRYDSQKSILTLSFSAYVNRDHHLEMTY